MKKPSGKILLALAVLSVVIVLLLVLFSGAINTKLIVIDSSNKFGGAVQHFANSNNFLDANEYEKAQAEQSAALEDLNSAEVLLHAAELQGYDKEEIKECQAMIDLMKALQEFYVKRISFKESEDRINLAQNNPSTISMTDEFTEKISEYKKSAENAIAAIEEFESQYPLLAEKYNLEKTKNSFEFVIKNINAKEQELSENSG
jgi:hypothetical protein